MRLSASPASGRHLHTSNTPVALLMCALVAMLVGTFAVPSTVYAQAVTGTLLGNVTDSSGAAVPGATVTATETQTNSSRTAVSNEAGHYIFSSLKNGTYTVEAELQGFRKVIRQNVRVDVNTTMRVDLTLELGQVTEAVTVAAETPLLQTDRTDTGRLLESKVVTEIPLGFNRNFQGLLVTVPGATRPFRPHSQFFNSQDSLSTEINGQPRMANNTLIEGLDNNQKTGLLSVIIPAADALETVSVSTSNYDAEFGRSGGAITNVTLKSGTNELQGQRVLLRQHRSDQRQRLLHSPQSADEVRAGRVHAWRPDHAEQVLLLRRLPADDRQPRLRRARDHSDDGDAQRRLQRRVQRHLRSDDGRGQRHAAARRLRTTRSRRNGSARLRAGCSRSFPSRTSPARRSARTTTRRRRCVRRRPTPSIRRSTTTLSEKNQISYRLSFQRPVVFDPGPFGEYGGPANDGFAGTGTNKSFSTAGNWTRVFSTRWSWTSAAA